MSIYLIRRILIAVPTLLMVLLISFFLIENIPGDPVITALQAEGIIDSDRNDKFDYRAEYFKKYESLGLDLPAFYFALVPSYYKHYSRLDLPLEQSKLFCFLLNRTRSVSDAISIKQHLLNSGVDKSILTKILIDPATANIETYISEQQILQSSRSFFMPRISFFGSNNRFHHWISNLFNADFGISKIDGRPVRHKIVKSLMWTVVLIGITWLIIILGAIGLAKISTIYMDGFWDKFIAKVGFIFFSVPMFWFATMMVVFFTTDAYGSWTNIFPSTGIDYNSENILLDNWHRLILPALCLALPSVAYLVRLLRSSIQTEMKKPYLMTLLANGLEKKKIVNNQIFKNGLISFSTAIFTLIPSSINGSIVIEVIFNLPGMGRLVYNSIFTQDWNVVIAILLLFAVFTVFVYIVADYFIKWLNPEVSL